MLVCRLVLSAECSSVLPSIAAIEAQVFPSPWGSDSLAATLAQQGIRTRDDLADLAVDELVEMAGIDEERAKALISVARAHWFEE